MATKLSTVEFLVDQISQTGNAAYKKMFGEYMIYLNGKPIFLVCDDTLFVKILPETKELLTDCGQAPPYNEAKPHFVVENVDDKEFLITLALLLEKILPLPKTKKK